jgi:hypothetical protein
MLYATKNFLESRLRVTCFGVQKHRCFFEFNIKSSVFIVLPSEDKVAQFVSFSAVKLHLILKTLNMETAKRS